METITHHHTPEVSVVDIEIKPEQDFDPDVIRFLEEEMKMNYRKRNVTECLGLRIRKATLHTGLRLKTCRMYQETQRKEMHSTAGPVKGLRAALLLLLALGNLVLPFSLLVIVLMNWKMIRHVV